MWASFLPREIWYLRLIIIRWLSFDILVYTNINIKRVGITSLDVDLWMEPMWSLVSYILEGLDINRSRIIFITKENYLKKLSFIKYFLQFFFNLDKSKKYCNLTSKAQLSKNIQWILIKVNSDCRQFIFTHPWRISSISY